MNLWVSLYILSIFLAKLILQFISIMERGEHFEIKGFRRLGFWWFVTVLWPIAVFIVAPYVAIRENLEHRLRSEADEIKYKVKLGSNKFDRSDIVAVPERELKILLKAYRKELIQLEKAQVEMIRDELMHRTAENQLLK